MKDEVIFLFTSQENDLIVGTFCGISRNERSEVYRLIRMSNKGVWELR